MRNPGSNIGGTPANPQRSVGMTQEDALIRMYRHVLDTLKNCFHSMLEIAGEEDAPDGSLLY
jgi:hypothetical protein